MEFEKITQVSLLYDFYGRLLTERQQDIMRLYYEENLSLAEIAQEFSISRQGVHDSLKNGEKALYEYEEKLELMKKFRKSEDTISRIGKTIDEIRRDSGTTPELSAKLEEMKAMIDHLDQ